MDELTTKTWAEQQRLFEQFLMLPDDMPQDPHSSSHRFRILDRFTGVMRYYWIPRKEPGYCHTLQLIDYAYGTTVHLKGHWDGHILVPLPLFPHYLWNLSVKARL